MTNSLTPHLNEPPGESSAAVKVDKKTIKELAAAHTEKALQTLASILDNSEASDMARIQAATALLDRGHGKPTQYVEQKTEIQTLGDLLSLIGQREKAYQNVVSVEVTKITEVPAKELSWEEVL